MKIDDVLLHVSWGGGDGYAEVLAVEVERLRDVLEKLKAHYELVNTPEFLKLSSAYRMVSAALAG